MAPQWLDRFHAISKRPSLYSDTRKLWSVTCIYLNQPPPREEPTAAGALGNRGFLMCGQCLLTELPGAVTSIASKPWSFCCVFHKGFTSTSWFHCQALHLNGQGPFQGPCNFKREKKELSAPPGVRSQDLNTRLKASHLVWSCQVKREWVSTATPSSTKSLWLKKKQKTKTQKTFFREHIGVTWSTKMSSLRRV